MPRRRLLGALLLATVACSRRHETFVSSDSGAGGSPQPPPSDTPSERDASVTEEDLDAGRDDGGRDDGGRDDAGDGAELPQLIDGNCLEGRLGDYCGTELDCPLLDDAIEDLSGAPIVVRRRCQAPDGTAMISAGSSYLNSSGAFIYDAQSGMLVAVYLYSDFPEFCGLQSVEAFYGAILPDCAFEAPDDVPDVCGTFFGMLRDGGTGPTPEECIFIEE